MIYFVPCVEIRKVLPKVIRKFRQEETASPDKVMSIEELGLLPKFKEIINGRLERLGVFIEVESKYYLSEKQLKEVMEQLTSRRRYRRW